MNKPPRHTFPRVAGLFAVLAAATTAPGHQGGPHPTGLPPYEDVILALEWFKLAGSGVKNAPPQDPLEPQTYELVNESPPGIVPQASVSIGWAFGSGHTHANYADFLATISVGQRLLQVTGNNLPGRIVVNPLTDGWSGTLSVVLQHTKSPLAFRATATWNFTPAPCTPCATLTCDSSTRIGSAVADVPVGPARFGQQPVTIAYESKLAGNAGPAALAVRGPLGTQGATAQRASGALTSVQCGDHLARVVPAPAATDPDRFLIRVSSDATRPDDTVFRETVFEEINDEDGRPALVITENVAGRSTTRRFSRPDDATWILEEQNQRRTTETILSTTAATRVTRRTVEERNAAGEWATLEVRDEEETKFGWGWETTRLTLDPDGRALTTTWDFYENGEATGPNGDTAGRGRLQSITLPTGGKREFEYHDADPLDPSFARLEITREDFAGSPGAKETRIHTTNNGTQLARREETWVHGLQVARTDIAAYSAGGTNWRTETRYPSPTGTPLVTRVELDNQPLSPLASKTTFPDGTVEVVHEVHAPASNPTTLTRSVFRGTPNPSTSGPPVRDGSEERTVVNRAGQTVQHARFAIRGGTSFRIDEHVATELDTLNRPRRFEVFHGNHATASWTETLEYGCCDVALHGGPDGISTHRFLDLLGRVRKTHRNGIATEIVRDGLVTSIHRYPEPQPTALSLATPDNLHSTVTSNLAGEITATARRSPADGSLVTTTLETLHQPAPGIGTRVTTTLPATPDDLGTPARIIEDFHPDGQTAGRRGSLVAAESYAHDATAEGLTVLHALVDESGNPREATLSTFDWLDQPLATTFSGDADGNGEPDRETYAHDAGGRLARHTDADGVTTLFAWDPATFTRTTALDLNRNGTIDPGTDEIRLARQGVASSTTGTILWSEELFRDAAGEHSIARTETSADGLSESIWSFLEGGPALTRVQTTRLAEAGAWDTTTQLPDGTTHVARHRGGLPAEEEALDTNNQRIALRQFTHDTRQRLTRVADTANPAVEFQYLAPLADTIIRQTTADQSTSWQHDHRGRLTRIDGPDTVAADGSTVPNLRQFSYFPHGGLREESGSPGHRLAYSWDFAHRLASLTTFGTTEATTRWQYDPHRGWPAAKQFPGEEPATRFSRTPAGRPLSHTDSRGITTTWHHGNDGRPVLTEYSDGTPSVAILARDLLGRVTRLADAAGERTFTYAGLTEEAASTIHQPGHLLAGWDVTATRDNGANLAALALTHNGADHHRIDYARDPAGLLHSARSGPFTAVFHHDPQRPLLVQHSVTGPAGTPLYTSHSRDSLGRLTRLTAHNGSLGDAMEVFADHNLERDPSGRIRQTTLEDKSTWLYGYDPAGQLASADRTLGDQVLPGHRFRWSHDAIGNPLAWSRNGSTENPDGHPCLAAFDPRNLPTSLTHPGRAEIFGEAPLAATVTVNGTAASRHGPFFHHSLQTDTSDGPARVEVAINDSTRSRSGHLLLPPATVAPGHDANGNLTNDGLWSFQWDAENRLRQAETTPAATAAGAPYRRLTYTYDAQSRLIARQRFDDLTATTPAASTRFLHAGWRCLGEVDETDTLARTFVWGPDSAGQVHLGDPNHALLWLNDHRSGATHLAHSDPNGNVAGLVDAASGHASARYHYAPYGETLAATGPYADQNPWRFSTHFQDPDTGLIHFGLRWLHPAHGRWLSREPLGELVSPNLFTFVRNDPVNFFDVLGASPIETADEGVALMAETRALEIAAAARAARAYNAARWAVITVGSTVPLGTVDRWGTDCASNYYANRLLQHTGIEGLDGTFHSSADQYLDQAAEDAALALATAGLGKIGGPYLRNGASAAWGWAKGKVGGIVNRTRQSTAGSFAVSAQSEHVPFGKTFHGLLDEIKKADFSTPKDGAVFWTGYKEGNQALATKWAQERGKMTIEMTSGGKWLDDLQLFGPNSPVKPQEANHLWRAASSQFARGASGQVNAFTAGTFTDYQKVFYGLELRLLQGNSKVNPRITYRGY